MGIGGSGMSSIAKYLKQKGHDVEGYDQRISYITNILESDGVKTFQNLDNFKYQEDVPVSYTHLTLPTIYSV